MESSLFRLVITACSLTLFDAAKADSVEGLAAIDFSLRLPSALSKFSAAGDVAGVGGASAGSPYSSGINPASIEWSASLELPLILSPEFSRIQFAKTPDMRVATVTGSINTPNTGGYQATISKVASNDSADLNSMQLEGDYAQIQWGKKITDNFAVGVNLNYTDFNIKATMDGFLVADGDSRTRGTRAGVLWRALPRLLAGVVMDYSTAASATNFLDIECFCYIPVEDNTNKTTIVRTGINYEYRTLSSIYMDYVVGRFRNSSQSMTSKTLLLGIEHQLFPWLYARAGIARDFRGVNGKTMGLGIVPSANVSVDLAYQQDMFPELLPEFGDAEVINLSVNLSF